MDPGEEVQAAHQTPGEEGGADPSLVSQLIDYIVEWRGGIDSPLMSQL